MQTEKVEIIGNFITSHPQADFRPNKQIHLIRKTFELNPSGAPDILKLIDEEKVKTAVENQKRKREEQERKKETKSFRSALKPSKLEDEEDENSAHPNPVTTILAITFPMDDDVEFVEEVKTSSSSFKS